MPECNELFIKDDPDYHPGRVIKVKRRKQKARKVKVCTFIFADRLVLPNVVGIQFFLTPSCGITALLPLLNIIHSLATNVLWCTYVYIVNNNNKKKNE